MSALRLAHSLAGNVITDEGVIKLAKVLSQTNINILKCAAAPCVRFCVSAR